MKTYLVILLSVFCFVAADSSATMTNLCVATDGNDSWSGGFSVPTAGDGPLPSLVGARNRIREMKAAGWTGSVTVFVRNGTYYESETLVLEPQDSGTVASPIVYKAYPGESPVISGGRKLGTPSSNPDGSYAVSVPEAAGRAWAFRQLFIDDDRYTLARSPNTGYYTVKDVPPVPASPYYGEPYWFCHEFIFNPGDLQNWSTLPFNEVTLRVYSLWEAQTVYLTSVDEASNTAFSATHVLWGYTPNEAIHAGGMSKRYVVENAPGSMDAPGEWQLDRDSGLLTAIPFEGEDLSTKTWVAPVTKVAVTVAGNANANQFVEHVRFEDICFRHYATPTLPTGLEGGWRSNQAALYSPACIDIAGSRHIEFKRCELAHIGMHGIEFGRGCVSNTVEQCHLHDLGGAGIYLGEMKSTVNGYDPGAYGATYGNTIYNNYIHDGGIIHQGAAGFMIGQAYENRVAHNEIAYFNWSGMQIGWNWDTSPTWSKDNVLEYNYIHDIGQNVLSDLAGIYTVGENLNTVIRGNVVHDIFAWEQGSGKGLYPDQETDGVTFSENLVYNAGCYAFGINFCGSIVVSNNIFALSYGPVTFDFGHRGTVSLTHNIFYYPYGHVYGDYTGGELDALSWFPVCDYNLYWRIGGAADFYKVNNALSYLWPETLSFSDWQTQSGLDANSMEADPMFADPYGGDFSFTNSSAADAIGFNSVDWSQAGLEGDPAWVALPDEYARGSEYVLYGEVRPDFFTTPFSATMTNLCDGTNGDEDEWGRLDDWLPYPPTWFPASTTDVVLGGGGSDDHAAFILNGVNAVCSNLTFGALCKPNIMSGGTLHVYGDILNSASGSELYIESGGDVTVDGVVNDSGGAFFTVRDGGTLTVNGAGLSDIGSMSVYGSADVSIPGSVSVNVLRLYDDGLLFTEDVTLGSLMRYSDAQTGVMTGEVSGAILWAGERSIQARTDTTLILSGVLTNTTGNFNGNDPNGYSGTVLITGQSNSRSGTLNAYAGKFFLNESNGAATTYFTLYNGATIGGTAVYDDMRLQVDATGGGTIDPGYNTGMIGTFGHTGSSHIEFRTGTTLNIDIDGTGTGTNDLLLAGGNLELYEGCIVTFNVLGAGPDDDVYVFAEYGALTQQGSFSVANGLPANYDIVYDYEGNNQIALVRDSEWTPANITNTLPYAESFESYAVGTALGWSNGWYGTGSPESGSGWTSSEWYNTVASDAVVSSNETIITALNAYDAACGFPITTDHTRYLDLVDNVQTRLDVPESRLVSVDMMLRVIYSLRNPAEDPDIQVSLYFNESGHPVLRHRDILTGANSWATCEQLVVAEGDWARLAFALDYTAFDSAHNVYYYQAYIDGILLTNALGYSTNDGTGLPGGSWFAMARQTPTNRFSSVLFETKSGQIDDVVIRVQNRGTAIVIR